MTLSLVQFLFEHYICIINNRIYIYKFHNDGHPAIAVS